jgi:hypothetical protein
MCPISLEIPRNPVVARDGYVYESTVIKRWRRTRATSPMTNLPMRKLLLHCPPLLAILELIADK